MTEKELENIKERYSFGVASFQGIYKTPAPLKPAEKMGRLIKSLKVKFFSFIKNLTNILLFTSLITIVIIIGIWMFNIGCGDTFIISLLFGFMFGFFIIR